MFLKDESLGCYAHYAECTKPVRVNDCLIHSRVKFTETEFRLGPIKGWERRKQVCVKVSTAKSVECFDIGSRRLMELAVHYKAQA